MLPGIVAALVTVLAATGCDSPSGPLSNVRTIQTLTSAVTIGEGSTVEVVPAGSPALDQEKTEFRTFIVAYLGDADGTALIEPIGGSSTNGSVAEIEELPSGGAVIRAIRPGSATLTLEAGQGSAQLEVRVVPAYVLTILGSPDDEPSGAMAINNAGQVVGYATAPSGPQRAVLWEGGPARALPGLPDFGEKAGIATAINDDGLIGGMIGGRAVLWSPQGEATDLWSSDQPVSIVKDINSAGDLVADAPRGMGTVGWVRIGGVFEETPLFSARAINDSGLVVGTTAQIRSRSSAAAWKAGEVTLLADCSQITVFCEATDVNDEGVAVGKLQSPVMWKDGATVSLVDESSTSPGTAVAINDRGEVLLSQGTPGLRLALRTEGRFVNVNALHTDPDWLVSSVEDINDRGEIVGQATHVETGVSRAVLLTPPHE